MPPHLNRENDEQENRGEGDPRLDAVDHEHRDHDQFLATNNRQVVPSLMCPMRSRGLRAVYADYTRALASSVCAGTAECEPLPPASSQNR